MSWENKAKEMKEFFRKTTYEKNNKIKKDKETMIYVYTAGKMPTEEENISDTWRGKLESSLGTEKFKWLHPTLTGCDHSGVDPETTVNHDCDLIENSDLVLAYLDQSELYGTISEIMYAAALGKHIGLIFILNNLENAHDWRNNHGCDCCWDANGKQAHEYWFMEHMLEHKYKKQIIFNINDIKEYEAVDYESIPIFMKPEDVTTELINKIYNIIKEGSIK